MMEEATSHTKKATELLRQSQAIHLATKTGLIKNGEALDAVVELNKQAAEEIGKALELRKRLIEKLNRNH